MEVEGSLVGRTLGTRFRIEKCIGRGGMATVYAAHVESGDRAGTDIALKVVNRELTRDPMVLRRFHREAKSASRLKHPNTVEVYEYGVDGDDAFIAMELAQGQDLLQALSAENPMRQARAALIVAQICSGLSAAHAQGIIHRDLKPENVMLIPDSDEPGGERVKVLDFGIAKIVDTPKPGGSEDEQPSYVTKTALTRVGTIVGTPAYMSPEQCRGGELDGRSDVYSCGVLLYQILTGEVPFTGETPLHTAMRHIHAQPKPPRELRASLAPALEKVVLKALAKWPGERHQTAEQLRDELLALVTSLPDAQGIDASKLPGAKPIVIPGKAKPEAGTDATELVIQTDPRMENGALGAGKLGSVRLSSLAAMQTKPSSPPPAAGRPASGPPAAPAAPAAAPPAGAPGARAAFTKTEAGQPSAAPISPPTDEPKTAERRPAQTKPAHPPPPPVAKGGTGKTPVGEAPRASGGTLRPPDANAPSWVRGVPNASPTADADAVNRRNTMRGGYTPAKAGDSPDTVPRSDGNDEPRTIQTHARDAEDAVTGQAQAPAVATQPLAQHAPAAAAPAAPIHRTLASAGTRQSAPGAPRPRNRPTETGLTPTAQIARDRIAAAEEAALASAPSVDDDDEPQTFIRTPPASMPGDAQAAGLYNEPSYSDDEKRTAHNTLVMDESQARQVSPAAHLARAPAHAQDPARLAQQQAAQQQQRSPNLPRTLDAQVDPNARAMIDAAYNENIARGPAMSDPSHGAHPMMQPGARMQSSAHFGPGDMGPPMNAMAPTQLPLSSSQIVPGHPSHGMPPSRPAPEEFADASSVGSLPRPDGFGQIKSTIRMSPEAAQRAASMYPVGLRRTQTGGPAGLRGKLEEFSGAALLLIGIAVGLFLALIGLVVVILMK